MKITFLLLFLWRVYVSKVYPSSFYTTVGGSGDHQEYGYGVSTTSDGGYIVTGFSNYFSTENNLVIVRYDYEGNHVWGRYLGEGNSKDIGYSVVESLGDIYVCGYTESFGAFGGDMIFCRFSENGDLIWVRRFGGNGNDQCRKLLAHELGIIFVGYSSSMEGSRLAVFGLISPDGIISWVKGLNGTGSDYGYSIDRTTDGGIVVGGITNTHGNTDAYIAKISPSPTWDLEWVVTLGGGSSEELNEVKQLSDGGYAVAGSTKSFTDGSNQHSLLGRFFSNGTFDWAVAFGSDNALSDSYERAKSVLETEDGDLIAVASISPYQYVTKLVVVKFSGSGEEIYTRGCGGGGTYKWDCVEEAVLNSYGQIVSFGRTNSWGVYVNDFFLSVIESDGIQTGCHFSTYDMPSIISCDGISSSYITGLMNVNDLSVGESEPLTWNNVTTSAVSASSFTYEMYCRNYFSCPPSGCSLHGDCVPSDVCVCTDSYFGSDCNGWNCFNISQNDTENICPSLLFGSCISPDVCVCQDEYFGESCNITTCNGLFSNDSENVCNTHGVCVLINRTCNCSDGYVGDFCDDWECEGIRNTNTSYVCGGNYSGICEDIGPCTCFTPTYFGPSCSVTFCGSLMSNESEVCEGRGKCIHSTRTCDCEEGYYGAFCELHNCYNITYNDSKVCSGHGSCTDPDNCTCLEGYDSKDCSQWSCFGFDLEDILRVCSGHGECIGNDNCSCVGETFSGEGCNYWECWGKGLEKVGEVCGGHGFCISVDLCLCLPNYYSDKEGGNCTNWFCSEIDRKSSEVCSGRGVCSSHDRCDCYDDYEGAICETWSCGNYNKEDSKNVCSGKGECVSPKECECEKGYGGELCQKNEQLVAIFTPIFTFLGLGVSILVLACCCCLCCCLVVCACIVICLVIILSGLSVIMGSQKSKMKRFSKLRDIDLLLKEQEMNEDKTIAHLRIKKDLYKISFSEIEVDRVVGEGGSNSIVFKAFWKNNVCAFKCFKTRQLCGSQDSYNEFEREVEILGSISHPNIVTFYGASLKPPRVGILMEFCENGDLDVFLKEFRVKYGIGYPLNEKIRMIQEILMALGYIHCRNIIHRDIKMENILVDKNFTCKLMDFGLSKIVMHMSKQKTQRIGTMIYMSPELVVGEGKYDSSCDIFSFGVLVWILITENRDPYGEVEYGIEMKVANDPTFRPDVEEMKKCLSKDLLWLVEVVTTSWDSDRRKRWSSEQLLEVFMKNKDYFEKSSGKKLDYRRSTVLEEGEEEECKNQEVTSSRGSERDETDLGEHQKEIEGYKKEIERLKKRVKELESEK